MDRMEITDLQADPCEDVIQFATRMMIKAAMSGGHVRGAFNQHTFHAARRVRLEEVIRPWVDEQRRSYFGRDR